MRSLKKEYTSLKIALLMWVQFLFVHLSAQSPSHFFIGASELAGIDIYSIHKSPSSKLLFIGTSNGVFVHKDGKFQELIKSPLQKGASFFQIQENYKGDLFCSNLHGQLFQLKNDSIKLFVELPLEEVGDQFHYFINTDNSIIYASKVLGRIYPDKTREILTTPNCGASASCQFFDANILGPNKYLISFYNLESSVIYDNGALLPFVLPQNFELTTLGKADSFSLQSLDGHDLLFFKGGLIVPYDSVNIAIEQQSQERLFPINSSRILALNPKAGARILGIKENSLVEENRIFETLFLSAAQIQEDGSIYLGTFGNGVCIIPSLETAFIPIEASLRGITAAPDRNCYVSCKEGEIYQIGQSAALYHRSERPLDWIFHSKIPMNETDSTHLLFDPLLNSSSGVLKDYYQTDDPTVGFLATSVGIFAIGDFQDATSSWVHHPEIESYQLKGVSGRQKTVAYNLRTKILYHSDESDLYAIPEKGKAHTLRWESKRLTVNDLELFGDTLICATEDLGLLFFHDTVPLFQLNQKSGLLDDKLKKIKRVGDKLFILSAGGFQSYHLKSEVIQNYGVPEGVIENVIIDFDASAENIFLLLNKGVLRLPLDGKQVVSKDISLRITKATLANKPLFSNALNQFEYDENKLEVYFDFTSELLKNETKVYYKLLGAESDWNEVPKDVQVIQYQSLAPGQYQLILESRSRGVVSAQYVYEISIDAPFWLKWWFFALFAGIILLISYFFYKKRLQIQEAKARQINELNASKLAAIQSQMNPHFIFNSLNSIQDLVLKGDVDNSYTFITKFSNLVRRTLNYSDKDFIDFEQEIKLIELYLSLEKLRFKELLEFTIETNNIEDIQVPPMLIQPFIENALLHGLLHKEGLKKLEIKFELKEHLICTITDNGIGRKKSMEIKERQRSDHESFSGTAIEKRFTILERHFGGDLGFSYQDLENDGSAIGTRVVLRIPVKHRY